MQRSMAAEPAMWFVRAKESGCPRTRDVAPPGSPDCVHRALAPVLVTAQCFGLMPVGGVTAPTASGLRFRWVSLRVAYCALVFVGEVILLLFSCLRLWRIGITFPRTAGAMFYVSHLIAIVLFLQLARRWPRLMLEWEQVEQGLAHYGPPPRLARTFRAIATAVLLGALVEHVLSNMNDILVLSSLCPGNWLHLLACRNYAAFEVVSYAPGWIPLFFAFNLLATFSWSYLDVFIMLLSLAVSARFRQLNRRLRTVRAQFLPEAAWRQFREDYNSISFLTKRLDARVSKLVLLSFGNNLYFICVQLLNSMTPMSGSVIDAIYFYWSFGYLLLKTCAVSLLAADIFERSKEPKALLYAVPHDSYCVEVQRFLTQVISDDIALTGLNFFSVTRTLLLTVAGTIVTYEIVLVQFNNLGDTDEDAKVLANATLACQRAMPGCAGLV